MSDDEEEGMYRAETVPPPDGESDPYSAPTKVGPMAAQVVAEMMRGAEQKARELNARVNAKREDPRVEPDDIAPPSRPAMPPAAPLKPAPPEPKLQEAPPPQAKPARSEPKPQEPPPERAPPAAQTPAHEAAAAVPTSAAAAALEASTPKSGAPPRVYEEEEDDHAATLLNRDSKHNPNAAFAQTASSVIDDLRSTPSDPGLTPPALGALAPRRDRSHIWLIAIIVVMATLIIYLLRH